MAIPTSRAKKPAMINIDEQLCTACGLCVSVCKGFGLKIENNKSIKRTFAFVFFENNSILKSNSPLNFLRLRL